MPEYNPLETALVLIDVQLGFNDPTHWGRSRSTPNFESNIKSLLAASRTAGSHVFHVCHHSTSESSPLHPSKESSQFMPYAVPLATEPVFIKSVNSSLVGTGLQAAISEHKIKRLVFAGLTTPHCVSTTVRMASNLHVVDHDYGSASNRDTRYGAIVLVSDATATFNVKYNGVDYDAETMHTIHLAALNDEFCDVKTTAEVLAQLQAVKG